jgi:hypothetical protein
VLHNKCVASIVLEASRSDRHDQAL